MFKVVRPGQSAQRRVNAPLWLGGCVMLLHRCTPSTRHESAPEWKGSSMSTGHQGLAQLLPHSSLNEYFFLISYGINKVSWQALFPHTKTQTPHYKQNTWLKVYLYIVFRLCKSMATFSILVINENYTSAHHMHSFHILSQPADISALMCACEKER